MISYTVTTDANLVAKYFQDEAIKAPIRVAAITQRNGQRLLEMVRVLSPFRTGEYRASHQLNLIKIGNTYGAEVYSDLPRGRILEFGGDVTYPDGTTRERGPRPHYRPAFEFVSAQYYDELSRFIT